MSRFKSSIMPAIAALVVMALVITFIVFSHHAASSSHHLVADDPTPTDTATPMPTDTPLPTATPEPTDTPLPTATPIPAPGKLVVNGPNPAYYGCQYNPTGDPALDGWGEYGTQVTNTGGRAVYWTVTSTDPVGMQPASSTSGTLEPGGLQSIYFNYYDTDITINIAWSDHVSASGNLSAKLICIFPTP